MATCEMKHALAAALGEVGPEDGAMSCSFMSVVHVANNAKSGYYY